MRSENPSDAQVEVLRGMKDYVAENLLLTQAESAAYARSQSCPARCALWLPRCRLD